MLTAAQYAANLKTAVRVAAARVGALTATGEVDTAQLPYGDRENYVTILSGIILAHPDLFDPAEVARAQAEQTDTPNPQLDSYTVAEAASDFVATAIQPVAEAAQNIGKGALTVANAAKWAIPAVAVVVVVILLFSLFRRTAGKASTE